MKKLISIAFFITSSLFAEAKPPNIVWIISEDNSPLIGAYGDSLAHTPNIDRLAGQSVQFEHAYANAPVCAPSRSTLINGVYASALGTQHMRSSQPLPEYFQHFPWYLRQAGYFTTNRMKKDYNTPLKPGTWSQDNWWNWDEAFSGWDEEKPFFLMYNTWMSHEGKIHRKAGDSLENYVRGTLEAFGVEEDPKSLMDKFEFDPDAISLPAYHPDLPTIRQDWAYYYKCIALMDYEVGLILDKLEQDGLLDDTIVFYFSDHGGVLPRSKRFIYNSGLRVPLLVHLPEKYSQWSEQLQSISNSVVEFVDLAPTVLEMAGVATPDHFSGVSLLSNDPDARSVAFGFRGRMDERYDSVRTATNGKFRYVRDYVPHRKEGGKVRFLWMAASMRAWEQAYKDGNTNDAQSLFWEPNPSEALFDTSKDPDEVKNLIDEPQYADLVSQFRKEVDDWMIESRDTGLIPEPMMVHLAAGAAPYDWIRSMEIPYRSLLDAANLAIRANASDVEQLVELSHSKHPPIRYWAVTGLTILAGKGVSTSEWLLPLQNDAFPTVRLAVAEGCYLNGQLETARIILSTILNYYRIQTPDELEKGSYQLNNYVLTWALNLIDTYEKEPDQVFPEIADLIQPDLGYPTRMAGYLTE